MPLPHQNDTIMAAGGEDVILGNDRDDGSSEDDFHFTLDSGDEIDKDEDHGGNEESDGPVQSDGEHDYDESSWPDPKTTEGGWSGALDTTGDW